MVPKPNEDQALEAELEALRRRYEGLKEQKVRLEQDQAHLAGRITELEDAARAEFGTADPAELERLLEERRAENRRLVEEYRKHLQGIQENLSTIEAQASGDERR
ncbi:hypothetical protein M7784_01455 [Desulfovibrio aminophilus]|nr:hypothetical protein [Desulfovibrio aminophilus]MCM0753913.1 hypothetical protein [Desulfovibrio aminophilus]